MLWVANVSLGTIPTDIPADVDPLKKNDAAPDVPCNEGMESLNLNCSILLANPYYPASLLDVASILDIFSHPPVKSSV